MTLRYLYKPILLQTACFNPVEQGMMNHCSRLVSTQQFRVVGMENFSSIIAKYVALEPSVQTFVSFCSPIQAPCSHDSPLRKLATKLSSSSLLIETKSLLIFRHVSLASLQFFSTVQLFNLQQYLLNNDQLVGHVSVKYSIEGKNIQKVLYCYAPFPLPTPLTTPYHIFWCRAVGKTNSFRCTLAENSDKVVVEFVFLSDMFPTLPSFLA